MPADREWLFVPTSTRSTQLDDLCNWVEAQFGRALLIQPAVSTLPDPEWFDMLIVRCRTTPALESMLQDIGIIEPEQPRIRSILFDGVLHWCYAIEGEPMLRALQFASNIQVSVEHRRRRALGDDWYYLEVRTENPRTGQSWTIDDLNRYNVGFNHQRNTFLGDLRIHGVDHAAQETTERCLQESTPEAGQQEYQRIHQGGTLPLGSAEVRQEEGAQNGRGSRAQVYWPRTEAATEITPEGETIVTERTTHNGRTIIDRFRVGPDGVYTQISRDFEYNENRDVFRTDPNRSDQWRVVRNVLQR